MTTSKNVKNTTKELVKKDEPKNYKSENEIVISPKTIPMSGYYLKSLDNKSIQDLAKVLGVNPKAMFDDESNLKFSYGKKFPYLFENSIICFDNQKNILWIKSYEDVQKSFNILK